MLKLLIALTWFPCSTASYVLLNGPYQPGFIDEQHSNVLKRCCAIALSLLGPAMLPLALMAFLINP